MSMHKQIKATEIQISVTKIIQFKFVYTVEHLAKYFQVNPEAILANWESYAEVMSTSDTFDMVLPPTVSITKLVFSAPRLEAALC